MPFEQPSVAAISSYDSPSKYFSRMATRSFDPLPDRSGRLRRRQFACECDAELDLFVLCATARAHEQVLGDALRLFRREFGRTECG